MNPDMLEALQALATDKGISVDALLAALADALESAYKRMPNLSLIHISEPTRPY